MLWFMSMVAFGQTVSLTSGDPEFSEGCLEVSQCEDNFYGFLGRSMIEQGFVFQNAAMLSTPLNLNDGWVFGASATTFPFAGPRENLAGKEENTSFSPVLPKIHLGRLGMISDRARLGTGLTFVPPVPVGGASALLVGVDLSVGVSLSSIFSIGLEGDFTYAKAKAPIVASSDQIANADSYNGNLKSETVKANCGGDDGCIDTFTVMNPGLRATLMARFGRVGISVEPGLNVLNETLEVAYDETEWKVTGLQPALNLEAAIAASQVVSLAAGAGLAARSPDHDGSGPYFKSMFQAVVSF